MGILAGVTLVNPILNLATSGLICPSLRQVRDDAPLLLSVLRDYPKFRSVVACAATGLAVPDAMLLTHWSFHVEQATRTFMQRIATAHVLIRSERLGGGLGSPSRQQVTLPSVPTVIRELMDVPNRMIAIQAAGVLWRNLHNINLMFDPGQPVQLLLEVVGPGFTARDLNRYGLMHEQIVLPSYAMEIHTALVRRPYVITDKLYAAQREAKLAEYRRTGFLHDDAIIWQATHYQPLPLAHIRTLWDDLPALRTVLEWLELDRSGAIVSMSFLQRANGSVGHCYWDIHPLRRSLA